MADTTSLAYIVDIMMGTKMSTLVDGIPDQYWYTGPKTMLITDYCSLRDAIYIQMRCNQLFDGITIYSQMTGIKAILFPMIKANPLATSYDVILGLTNETKNIMTFRYALLRTHMFAFNVEISPPTKVAKCNSNELLLFQ